MSRALTADHRIEWMGTLYAYTQHAEVVGEVPTEIRLNAKALEVRTWLEFEQRLRAQGADDQLCEAGKRIWRRYRVAARSTLA